MPQALLVIDVQESFRRRPYWQPEEAPAFLANVQALADRCRARGIPVPRSPQPTCENVRSSCWTAGLRGSSRPPKHSGKSHLLGESRPQRATL